MAMWENITALGGLPCTGLVALAVACVLLTAPGHPWRVATRWGILFGTVLALAAASQIAFLGWGIGIEQVSFAGLSGHAARAATVFPVALCLPCMRYGRRARTLAVATGCLAAALVALSRVMIGAHSPAEAAAGFLLGTTMALAFIWHARHCRPHFIAILVVALCFMTAFSSAPSEMTAASTTHQWLTGVALNLSGHDRPYSRADWKPAASAYVPPCAATSVRFHYLCI